MRELAANRFHEFRRLADAIENAVIKIVQTSLKSLAAGKMGYSTQEVGDLVVKLL